MRVVIDTNSLQSDELRAFLSADYNNMAVLPEHTIVEIFKPAKLEAVWSSFEVLRDYPSQILQLKSNRDAADTDVTFPGFANRFVDEPTSREMPMFIELLRRAVGGDESYAAQIAQRREWALERLDRATAAFGDIADQLAAVRSQFDPADLTKLAKEERTSQEFKLIILKLTDEIVNDIWRQRRSKPGPKGSAKHNDFTWRYVLCHLLQLLRLSASGNVRRKPSRAVNDHMDNVFATYGTYFNGLMTHDAEANETHVVGRIMLDNIGVRIPPDYKESGYMLSVIDWIESSEAGQ